MKNLEKTKLLNGHYIIEQNQNVLFSFISVFPQNESTQKIVPGPGSHEDKQVIHPLGTYHLSNRRSSKSKNFNPPCSKRFTKSTT